MSMAMMVAMASRKRDESGRYAEGNEMRRMENEMRRMGNDDREMEGRAEMRRRRDERGRYMEEPESPRMTTRGESNYRPWPEPHMPPYLEDRQRMERAPERMRDNNVVNIRDYQDRRQIGFSANEDERRAEGYDTRGYETARMHGGAQHKQQMQMGGAKGMGDEGLTREQAEKWVEGMEDKDGVKGGTYTWHQAQQYGRNLGITGQERLIEFYAAMNAMQSDYWPAAKKFGVDRPEFYAMMAKCFVEDPDAVEDKTRMYYECIARK
nr:MAG TPA_asm: hypothetical protein [Caudoviricetes sp.]